MSSRTHTQRKSLPIPAPAPLLLRRKCSCGRSSGPGATCTEYTSKQGMLRRPNGNLDRVLAPPIVEDALRSSGRPLEPSTREAMELGFGHDFSRVRVHTDPVAAESARAVNAFAYTVGRNIVFDSGQYDPYGIEGRRLIGHELAHVAQQSKETEKPEGGIAIAESREQEMQADRVSEQALSNPWWVTKPALPRSGPTVGEPAAVLFRKERDHGGAGGPTKKSNGKLPLGMPTPLFPPMFLSGVACSKNLLTQKFSEFRLPNAPGFKIIPKLKVDFGLTLSPDAPVTFDCSELKVTLKGNSLELEFGPGLNHLETIKVTQKIPDTPVSQDYSFDLSTATVHFITQSSIPITINGAKGLEGNLSVDASFQVVPDNDFLKVIAIAAAVVVVAIFWEAIAAGLGIAQLIEWAAALFAAGVAAR